MYDPRIVEPMRLDLTSAGVEEMKTAEEVDAILNSEKDTVLVVINSVCGCSAGSARPAVKMALKHQKLPKRITTVFAGQDKDATERARSYFPEYPPSSPSIALLKGGDLVHMIPRHQIEGRTAEQIAEDLVKAFDTHC